ncbi:polysaccharide biosynthesis protein [Lactiplantibacillus modestisalitolerans]|uniref:Polysaccharide biosynthesis protein n=1 Tax=Lactiplantibacillus modestisalitolerans TaxID=1457219 RepID=A0ABV5WYB1_9LACO|nr:polysaccharide biosynthesis protein [Lactiplantibacillus modestisalitolerans]
MPKDHLNTMFRGALILSVSSLVAKILSAVYRIPLQNMVGNTGFYVYQQIYPIYGIGMTFALNGFPNFISKLVAEQPDATSKTLVTRRAFHILSGLSLLFFIGLQLGAHWIAVRMGDPNLAPIIVAVSWMFLFMPWLASGRGYYQGQFLMGPTAVSQLVEQVVRVGVIIMAAYFSLHRGWDAYHMGTWAMTSAPLAAICSSVIFLSFGLEKLLAPAPTATRPLPSYRKLIKRFVVEGGTLCLVAAVVILLQLIDSFSVMRGLLRQGLPVEIAKSLKGVYDRGQPLVQLGLVIATSFSATLLPALTNALAKRKAIEFKRQTQAMVHVSLALSMAATVGLVVLMPEINRLLFGSIEGTTALRVYVLSILVAALITTYTSVLQSMDQYAALIVGIVAGLATKLLFNYVLVVHYGINGASLVTVLSLTVMFAVMWLGSPEMLQKVLLESGYLIKLVSLSGAMGLAVLFTNHQISALVGPVMANSRSMAGLNTLAGVFVGVVVFVAGAVVIRLFSIREWLVLPYGKRLIKAVAKGKENHS